MYFQIEQNRFKNVPIARIKIVRLSKLTLLGRKGVFLLSLSFLQFGLVKLSDLADVRFVTHCKMVVSSATDTNTNIMQIN